jgi:hypothetical protein
VTEVVGSVDAGQADDGRLVTGRFVVVTLATALYFTALGMQLPTIPAYVKDELGGGGIAVGFAAGIFACPPRSSGRGPGGSVTARAAAS